VTLAKSLTIKVGPGYAGIHDRDAEEIVSELTIPHWPINMMSATGSEGHTDMIQRRWLTGRVSLLPGH